MSDILKPYAIERLETEDKFNKDYKFKIKVNSYKPK